MTQTTPEQRLAAAGYALPPSPTPRGGYAPFHLHPLGPGQQLLSISGQTSRVGGVAIKGVCTPDAPLDPARDAARVAMLNALAAIALAAGGSLPASPHVIRVRGFVRASADFASHTRVLDAASDLLLIAWPEAPRPSRTAVGVSSLPDGAYIEIELDAVLVAGRGDDDGNWTSETS